MQQAIKAVESTSQKPSVPDIRPGDTVRVHYKFVEDETERVQVFEGVVIRVRGTGTGATFTVRRIGAHNIGIERIFPLHSPRIEKIEIVRRAKVRRSKLYYLRGLSGKAARLKEKRD
ncbi:MAG: 50S ribosomal protein L19 [Anaerolineae bacterium]|nr:50S ribosomal protein L19 [Anaerolineae bacterium]MDW8102393.1 50S ribosomal protein L19 [Anaerolineae bacterium]